MPFMLHSNGFQDTATLVEMKQQTNSPKKEPENHKKNLPLHTKYHQTNTKKQWEGGLAE